MKNSLVSIVIPVYNGQNHIRKCIESLLKQTYENIEIVVVNDGSSDNTDLVLDDVQKEDQRIRVVNQENKGVSYARNVGITFANGEYLLFVDSDDSLKENAIETIMKSIDNDSDLVVFGFSVIGNDNRKNDTKVLSNLKNSKADKYTLLQAVLSTKENIYGYAWRSLYSVKLLKSYELLFPEGIKISEDYLFFVKSIYYSNKVTIIDKELYNYNLGSSSMSTKYIPSLLHDMNYVNNWIYENIIKTNISFLPGYYCLVVNTYLRFVQNSFRDNDRGFGEISLDLINKKDKFEFNNSLKKVWNRYKCFDIKSYIGILLFRFHLDLLYYILFRIKVKIRE